MEKTTLDLTRAEVLDLLAAIELSPLEHEVVEQKLLDLVYDNNLRHPSAA